MVAIVACETLLLGLLVLLVAGLLRSHAEILRRLGPPEDEREEPGAQPGRATSELTELSGTTPEGDAVEVSLAAGAPPTLVAYLSSGCSVCHGFWKGLREGRPAELPASVRVVVVTKDTSHESPSRIAELRPTDAPVIMSSAAWRRQRVPAAPYFTYVVDGAVAGEGSASTWRQLASLLRDAAFDARARGLPRTGEERTDRVDAVLEAAGITRGHPSLHPGSPPGP